MSFILQQQFMSNVQSQSAIPALPLSFYKGKLDSCRMKAQCCQICLWAVHRKRTEKPRVPRDWRWRSDDKEIWSLTWKIKATNWPGTTGWKGMSEASKFLTSALMRDSGRHPALRRNSGEIMFIVRKRSLSSLLCVSSNQQEKPRAFWEQSITWQGFNSQTNVDLQLQL